MGGVSKRIIVFDNEGTYMTMFNPKIIKKSGPYDTEENFFLYSATLTIQALSGPQSTMANRRISNPNQNLYWFTDCSHIIDHFNGF